MDLANIYVRAAGDDHIYIYVYTYTSRLCECEWPGSWIESSGFAVNAEDEVSGSLPIGKYGVQPEKHLVAASYLVEFNDA